MKYLQYRNEDDAEGGGGVGHHGDFPDTDGHQDEREDRADKADVEAGVEEQVFVLDQFELHACDQGLAANFGQLRQAPDINERLDDEEHDQGEKAEFVHKRCGGYGVEFKSGRNGQVWNLKSEREFTHLAGQADKRLDGHGHDEGQREGKEAVGSQPEAKLDADGRGDDADAARDAEGGEQEETI